jgi:hypothetical protein
VGLPGLEVAEDHPRHPAAGVAHPLHHLGPGHDQAAVSGGGAGHRQGEGGVVGHAVGVDQAAVQVLDAESGNEPPHALGVQPLVALWPVGELVVHPEPEVHLPARRAVAVVGGVEEADRPDQVGVERHHPVTLPAGDAGDPELHLLQVPKAAVDQLRGARRGAGGDVRLLQEERPEAALGGVEEDAAAGDAAADHHEVEALAGVGQGVAAPVGVEHAGSFLRAPGGLRGRGGRGG